MPKIEVKSDLSGTVWKILVAPGQKVSEGDTLILIESMKMEVPIIADEPGTVVEVRFNEGDAVSRGQVAAILDV